MVDRDRVTSMRDPAAPGGAINILDIESELPKASTGSQYFSGHVNGKWVIVNGHRDVVGKQTFESEYEACKAAGRKNGMPEDELPEIESDR